MSDNKVYHYSYKSQQDPSGNKARKRYNLVVSDSHVAIRTTERKSIKDAAKTIDDIKQVRIRKPDKGWKKVSRLLSGKTVRKTSKVEIHVKGISTRLRQKVSYPESGVTVFKINADEELDSNSKIALRDEIRTKLKSVEKIEFAGRVLIDPETAEEVLYTGNVFVKFEPNLNEPRCLSLLDSFGFKKKSAFNNLYFVECENVRIEIFERCNQLVEENQTEVEACYPELIRERSSRAHVKQWHLHKTNLTRIPVFSSRNIDAHCNAASVWKYFTGKDVRVAVLDDGFDVDHQDFVGKVENARNFSAVVEEPSSNGLSPVYDPRPRDPYRSELKFENHGTACAGVACGGNKFGSSGVAPDAKLIPIRLSCGLGSMLEAEAIRYAVDQGADVINCSWGPQDGLYNDPDDPLHNSYKPIPPHTHEAIRYAMEHGRQGRGTPVVWAAGNGNEDIKYDGYASHPDVFAVGACSDRSKRCVYSDYGDQLLCVFPSADEEEGEPQTKGIWTTDRSGDCGWSDFNYYGRFSGTSSSAPGVAGLIALLIEKEPDLTVKNIRERLIRSCIKIDTQNGNYDEETGHSRLYGYGRPDAMRLLFPPQS